MNKINGRTPEKLKKKLEKCPNADCSLCLSSFHCDLEAEALEYIQQLERERDAAVRDMYHAASDGGSFCDICKYKGEPCDKRKFEEMECWQWRGVEVE